MDELRKTMKNINEIAISQKSCESLINVSDFFLKTQLKV
jgi:hypothetical protein